ncbi:MAG: PEP-CTERM sorting domain-containing protein [Planctomycetia bacterium]|nr:PEP-CTERM sorting domain-containing protein [Planctomycetia bacterium]
MKDNLYNSGNGGVVGSLSGYVTLCGDGSVGTFSNNHANGVTNVSHDIYAKTTVTIQDAGTYSLGGGIRALTSVTIDEAVVSFGEDATINTPSLTLQNGAKVSIHEGNFASNLVTLAVGSGSELELDSGSYDWQNLTLSGGGTILWTIEDADTYSQVQIDDTSNWTGLFDLQFSSSFTPSVDDSFVIANVFPDQGAEFDWNSLLASDKRSLWNLSWNAGALTLAMDREVALPEPGSWVLLGLGLLGLGGVARCRKSSRRASA